MSKTLIKLEEGAAYYTWLAIKCAAGGSNQRGNWGVKRDEMKKWGVGEA